VEILNRMSLPFKGVDVLADDTVREGIKVFSDWPTVPQLYVKGEFVGGCDIMREMYEAGELHQYMQSVGFEPTYA
jgi:monothiol glutaredoxin